MTIALFLGLDRNWKQIMCTRIANRGFGFKSEAAINSLRMKLGSCTLQLSVNNV